MCGACARIALILTTLLPSYALAETASGQPHDDDWTFIEAWRTFRYDLESTLPGEHGEGLLIERLHDEPPWLLRNSLRLARNPEVLSFLARRVSRRGDRLAIPALRQALGTTPSEASQRVLERALVRLGDDATLRTLSQRLHKGSPQIRREAANALGGTGQKAASILLAAMKSQDTQTILAAASALAGQGDRRAQKLLGEHLSSSGAYVRLEAAHALARAGDRRALPVLRKKLDRHGADRLRIIRSLGLVGGASERDLLVKTWTTLPKGQARAVHRELLLALGRIASRTTLKSVATHLGSLDEETDDDTGVRGAWLEALGWSETRGARDGAAYVAKLRESVESRFPGETPVAQQSRRQRVSRLIAILSGKTASPRRPSGVVPRATLEQWLGVKNPDDAKARILRFRAAVILLQQLGASGGYHRLADPPDAHPVGLGVERAVDGNLMTAWIAGSMAGPLRLDLPSSTRLKALHLINGCVDSERSFKAHARLKTVSITLGGGQTVTAKLVDGDPSFQRVELPSKSVDQITIAVTATYPGKAPTSPACVAEVRLESR